MEPSETLEEVSDESDSGGIQINSVSLVLKSKYYGKTLPIVGHKVRHSRVRKGGLVRSVEYGFDLASPLRQSQVHGYYRSATGVVFDEKAATRYRQATRMVAKISIGGGKHCAIQLYVVTANVFGASRQLLFLPMRLLQAAAKSGWRQQLRMRKVSSIATFQQLRHGCGGLVVPGTDYVQYGRLQQHCLLACICYVRLFILQGVDKTFITVYAFCPALMYSIKRYSQDAIIPEYCDVSIFTGW